MVRGSRYSLGHGAFWRLQRPRQLKDDIDDSLHCYRKSNLQNDPRFLNLLSAQPKSPQPTAWGAPR